ncbi:MAG: hypothetical protein HY938_03290 [Nitrosomonadales bacterium]|nr:hypothetical protein [Nitrosomonadales bacterium]
MAIHGFFHTADAFICTGYRCACNPSESVWGRGYFLLISFPQVAVADLNDAGEIHG